MDHCLAVAPVLEGVFHKGRKGKRRDQEVFQLPGDVDAALRRVGDAEVLDVDVVSDVLDLLPQGDQLQLILEHIAEVAGDA